MSATPETPDPLARVIEAVAAEIERDDDNSYCTYADTARQAVRAAAPLLLAAVVAEMTDNEVHALMAQMYMSRADSRDPRRIVAAALDASYTRLLARGEEGRRG